MFNPRENRKHFCGILLGILSFIGSVVGITFAILEHENSSGGVQGTVVTVGRGYGSSDEYDYVSFSNEVKSSVVLTPT